MIAIRKIIIPRHNMLIDAGQSVQTEIEVISGDTAPVLLTPSLSPVISIFNPSGTALVTDAAMTNISTGRFKYLYQTLANSSVGIYTGNITVNHLGEAARLEKISLFKILRTSTFSSFSYLRIQDANAVIWYWYIETDNTLNSISTVPSVLSKQAVEIVLAQVPRFLQLTNPAGQPRYVYPDVAGSAVVSASHPGGTGNVGSPTFTGLSGGNFVIALNASDEIIINTI